MIEEPKEEVDEGIKVINSLHDLMYPQTNEETKAPELEIANSVTEAEIAENLVEDHEVEDNETYIDMVEDDDEDPEFSGPIDIVTEHEDYDAPEENEILDETDDSETEFIKHETEPLLQDLAGQMMHIIEESTTKEDEEAETTTVHDQDDSEDHSNATGLGEDENTQTEAEQATEVIDVRVNETSEAENLEAPVEENKNEDLQELTTAVDEINTPTEKPVETESSAEIKAEIVHSTEAAESSSVTESIIDATTEAILELTSRTTVMEPNAEISSTIANFISNRNDEATTVSVFSSETTKDTRRKRCTTFTFKFIQWFLLFRENSPSWLGQLSSVVGTFMLQWQAVPAGWSTYLLHWKASLWLRVSQKLGDIKRMFSS